MEKLFKIIGPYDLATPLGGTRIFVDGVFVVEDSPAWIRLGLATQDPLIASRLEEVPQSEISKFITKS